ncbi:late competence development ComFB family protein [Bacterioplanoides sp.]|uniref:late competence development ComFB family protein n=1 Tax=Bacterioplanoides sp. TaxID=2066072 RepID=UPI003B00861D
MSINNNIRNYYEQLVAEEILARLPGNQDSGSLADIACVALNHLPPRYIRHEVDMAFYMSPDELHDIHKRVKQAVSDAIEFIASHRREDAE